jgi:hypothetical protein
MEWLAALTGGLVVIATRRETMVKTRYGVTGGFFWSLAAGDPTGPAADRYRSRMNVLSVDERLPTSPRSRSMTETSAVSVSRRAAAISFRAAQNGSSRLMLVLRPLTAIDRCTMTDFISGFSSYWRRLRGLRRIRD